MAPTVETAESPPMPAPSITDAEVQEMRWIDSTVPVVSQIKVSLHYSGELLAKDDGKWTPWSKFMKLKLTMSGLYEYVFDPPDLPHKSFEP